MEFLESQCTENFCPPLAFSGGLMSFTLVSLKPPDFPPPPPIPTFMSSYLQQDNLTETCDLCAKWGDAALLGQSGGSFTFVLALVAIVSALAGAGIMAAILSVRK